MAKYLGALHYKELLFHEVYRKNVQKRVIYINVVYVGLVGGKMVFFAFPPQWVSSIPLFICPQPYKLPITFIQIN